MDAPWPGLAPGWPLAWPCLALGWPLAWPWLALGLALVGPWPGHGWPLAWPLAGPVQTGAGSNQFQFTPCVNDKKSRKIGRSLKFLKAISEFQSLGPAAFLVCVS